MPRKTAKDASNPLLWIQKLIKCDNYSLSKRVYQKLEDGEFAHQDIVSSILSGSIRKVEKDEIRSSIDGKKYVITGKSLSGLSFDTVGKFILGIDGDEYFIITAYGRI